MAFQLRCHESFQKCVLNWKNIYKLKTQTVYLLHTTPTAQGKNYCLWYVTEFIVESMI